MTAVGQYIRNVAFALDRFGNAALGGDPDWTISQRMGQAIREDRCAGCYWVCRVLSLIDHRHCRRVYDPDKSHAERLWPASVAFGVGVVVLMLVAVSVFLM